MTVNELMEQKKLTKYKLSKNSGVPYTTVADICSGKARLEKCSAETVYRLASELGVTMEALIAPTLDRRGSFELFKSNVCHHVKMMGDVDFIIETLETDDIRKYYDMKWYPESLYLLAMLDYLSHANDVPLCTRYDDLRRCRLETPVFPASILTAAIVAKNDHVKKQALHDAIPEFVRFNIVESEVRNVL